MKDETENIKNLDEFWERLPELAAKAGYEAVQRHLAEGRPVYYSEDEHPDDIIKEYPDGSREIVTLIEGKEVFVRSIERALP